MIRSCLLAHCSVGKKRDNAVSMDGQAVNCSRNDQIDERADRVGWDKIAGNKDVRRLKGIENRIQWSLLDV